MPATRILIMGNSGSGKSTLARRLADEHCLEHLDLDTIVWEPAKIAVLRPQHAIEASLRSFMDAHPGWVIEGCYGELVESALPACTELIFLNPGEQACQANNAMRPWEPHKYVSKEEQDKMLPVLRAWVAGYYTRDDSWSLARHRRIFDSYDGNKREIGTYEPDISGPDEE